MLVAAVLLCSVRAEYGTLHYDDIFEYLYRRNVPAVPNYNESFFSSLENYAVNASQTTEDKYPWIARVVHSTSQSHPYVCTAACIEDKIFITAGRCLYSLKVLYTNIIYQRTHFAVRAFVVPSAKSKQGFDDIGFIVVAEDGFKGPWTTVQLFDTINRTDENFNWFGDLIPGDNWDHVVVGYATLKSLRYRYVKKIESPEDEQYKLSELNVITNIHICPEILLFNQRRSIFHVPCYYSCSVQQHKNKDSKCLKYHGVLGAPVFNIKTNKLLGIATWGVPQTKQFEMPVGFSVPNSKTFFEDYTCARRIKLDKGSLVMKGYYQVLCKDIKRK